MLAMADANKCRVRICRIANLAAETATGHFTHFIFLPLRSFLVRDDSRKEKRVWRATRRTTSRQPVKQRFGLFQIERVEAFGEPSIDRSEQPARLMKMKKPKKPPVCRKPSLVLWLFKFDSRGLTDSKWQSRKPSRPSIAQQSWPKRYFRR